MQRMEWQNKDYQTLHFQLLFLITYLSFIMVAELISVSICPSDGGISFKYKGSKFVDPDGAGAIHIFLA